MTQAASAPMPSHLSTPTPADAARQGDDAKAKKEAFEAAGVKVGKTPSETASLMRKVIQSL